jgi:beta-N-acetylhexosaminidase
MRLWPILLLTALVCGAAPAQEQAVTKPMAKAGGGRAERWLRALTLRERVAQLLMVPCYGDFPNTQSRAYGEFVTLVRDLKVGGLIVLNRVQYGSVQRADPYQSAAFLNRMQRLAKVPLLVGGDFERGASMRMTSTTPYPHLMAYGAANDLEATKALGAATARESRAMGVQWVFAPDADVNNNPENPIINIRSFGEDPQKVAAHVRAFVEGAKGERGSPVLTTVKHFPGHGDTATDSHLGLGAVTATKERLDEVELPPFQAGIEAGVDSVMTAHLAVGALETEEIPATVSKNILTGLLREQMKFEGIVTTDAMDMLGLARLYSPGEAAVRALEAGADLLLIPRDAQATVNAVVAAVKNGRLSQERINRSALKLLQAKVRVGLHTKKLVDIEAMGDHLNSAGDGAMASKVAERAVTAVKNEGGMLPLSEPGNSCWYVMAAGRFSMQGRELMGAVRARAPQAKVTLLDPQLPETEFEALAGSAAGCGSVVLATYVAAAANRGNVALAGNYPGFVEKVLAAGRPVALVSLGNPYLLRAYPGVAAYLATFSTAPPSEAAAVKAVLGEIEVDGKLPVSIPGLATVGFGIKIEKRK